MTEISYSGYRFPPEIIQQAICLWWLFAYFVVITIGSSISPHHKTIRALPRQGIVTALQASGPFGDNL